MRRRPFYEERARKIQQQKARSLGHQQREAVQDGMCVIIRWGGLQRLFRVQRCVGRCRYLEPLDSCSRCRTQDDKAILYWPHSGATHWNVDTRDYRCYCTVELCAAPADVLKVCMPLPDYTCAHGGSLSSRVLSQMLLVGPTNQK